MVDNIEKLIEKLLLIEHKHNIKIEEIESVFDGHIELTEVFPVELLDIALDLLSVPSDETLDDPNGFCRDWLRDDWYNIKEGVDPEKFVKSYIERVSSEMAKYKKNYSN